jgi:hypothetical protein
VTIITGRAPAPEGRTAGAGCEVADFAELSRPAVPTLRQNA